jgi:hypothetical protein
MDTEGESGFLSRLITRPDGFWNKRLFLFDFGIRRRNRAALRRRQPAWLQLAFLFLSDSGISAIFWIHPQRSILPNAPGSAPLLKFFFKPPRAPGRGQTSLLPVRQKVRKCLIASDLSDNSPSHPPACNLFPSPAAPSYPVGKRSGQILRKIAANTRHVRIFVKPFPGGSVLERDSTLGGAPQINRAARYN